MRVLVIGALLLSFCLLAGCAKYWYQEGRTFRETQQDLAACQAEAARYADVERTYGLGSYEKSFVTDCMNRKGYTLVPEKELPVRVKRQSSPVFGLSGVAGTID